MTRRITMIEGSSVAPDVDRSGAGRCRRQAARCSVCLDSNHTHEHVLAELEAYAPLTTVGSYCVVFDTIVEDLPAEHVSPTGPGARATTRRRRLGSTSQAHPEFEVDQRIGPQGC